LDAKGAVGSVPLGTTGTRAAAATFTPFLNIVPSGDGTEMYIQADNAPDIGGILFANITTIGPGGNKGSYTMVYSDTVDSYVATAVGFTPNTDEEGTINLTTTLGLESGLVDFVRAYVPASTSQTIDSADGNLQLSLVTTDTLTVDSYVAVVPSFAPPGPAPAGHQFIGSVYSVRAANALVETTKPMILRLSYHNLGDIDPHRLAIFAWDAFNKRWENLGGRLFATQSYVSVATSRFTTYALMIAPEWRDEFNDTSGLDIAQNVVPLAGSLVVSVSPGSGTAITKPITPSSDIDRWGTLTFTATTMPPTTTLTVDVLSLNGTEVLTDVVSGSSLADLDPVVYPSLRLRASMASATFEDTPMLEAWRLTWEVRHSQIYLPLVTHE
jgi:hypothetical protein